MNKEKSQTSNTSHSSSNGPVINDPESSQPFLDALSEASKTFTEPLMTREELAKY